MRSPSIELLWWEGCPSTERALADLVQALADSGLADAEVKTREVKTDADAADAAFVGSPTILIDGVDLVPAADDEPIGLSCRVYRHRDGRVSPVPDPDDLREALRRAAVTGSEPMMLWIGDPAPDFELPDTEGAGWSLSDADGAPATVVVFTCNHCPYALAWHDRIADAARDYADRGVRFLAINPNDGERYPGDSLEAMKQRVAEEDWPMPYLRDESQDVARAYGARTTPDVFVTDAAGRVRYRGAPDGDYGDPARRAEWLRAALDAVLAGETPALLETKPVGCSIKWRA
jgi:peroxiredoxin